MNRIINMSPISIFLRENEENWPGEYVSNNIQEFFGFSAEEFMTGKVAYGEIVHPDDLKQVMEEVDNYSRQHDYKNFRHQPGRITTKSGLIKWVESEEGKGASFNYTANLKKKCRSNKC